MKKQFRDFESARKFVRKLGLQSQREWYEYAKSGDKPDDIPSTPQTVYKNKGWKNWGDFLGTKNISASIKSKSFLPIKEAKPVYQKLFKEYNITNGNDWKKFAKTHGKLLEELHIPADVLALYNLGSISKSPPVIIKPSRILAKSLVNFLS